MEVIEQQPTGASNKHWPSCISRSKQNQLHMSLDSWHRAKAAVQLYQYGSPLVLLYQQPNLIAAITRSNCTTSQKFHLMSRTSKRNIWNVFCGHIQAEAVLEPSCVQEVLSSDASRRCACFAWKPFCQFYQAHSWKQRAAWISSSLPPPKNTHYGILFNRWLCFQIKPKRVWSTHRV